MTFKERLTPLSVTYYGRTSVEPMKHLAVSGAVDTNHKLNLTNTRAGVPNQQQGTELVICFLFAFAKHGASKVGKVR